MDLIDGSETKDGRVAGSSTVDVYSLGGEEDWARSGGLESLFIAISRRKEKR